tara:strand:+ start:232 stop:2400 length:2169 start_codon:yes stop_codon:yes gene_type:complete
MAVIREKSRMFNKPIGVVKSQVLSGEAETWKTISETSQALSAQVFKQSAIEADLSGQRQAMSADILDDNGNIIKAELPSGMGLIGKRAFEKQMMSRYQNQLQVSIDNKVMIALQDNPSDSESFNTSASIAIGALKDSVDPEFHGFIQDYGSAKISAGTNTALRNKLQIESEQRYAETFELSTQMANQSINAFLQGNKRLGEDLQARIENMWVDAVNNRDATASQKTNIVAELRRNIMKARLGDATRGFNSEEILAVVSATAQGRVIDLVDTERMVEVNKFSTEENKVSFDTIKTLIDSNPHVLDNDTIARHVTSLEQIQNKLENDQALELENINFKQLLATGQQTPIPPKFMNAYTSYVFNQSGVPFDPSKPLTSDQIIQLVKDEKNQFYTIIEQQQTIPKVLENHFTRLTTGQLENDEAFAMMEMFQNMKNNMSSTGIPRDITSAFGLKNGLNSKLTAINNLITFDNTAQGLKFAIDSANVPENLRVNKAIDSINKDMKPDQVIETFKGAKAFMFRELAKEFGDNLIANEVVDETLMLANITGAEDALEIMTATVRQKWVQSAYTVDLLSGGTALQTRYSPEVIFGSGTSVLQNFEAEVRKLSGVKDAVLGENVFVVVDPNSANSNVRYYLMKGEAGGSIEPIIKKNPKTQESEMISIELIEYADQMDKAYKERLKQNLDYTKLIYQANKDLEDYQYPIMPSIGGGGSYEEIFGIDKLEPF